MSTVLSSRIVRGLLGGIVAVLGLVVASEHTAHAYPQYQFSKGGGAQACVECHYAPAGGGLLNDMGTETLGDLSSRGGDARFLNGSVTPPSWLALGGEFRVAGGVTGRGDYGPTIAPALIPMQADLMARAVVGDFSFVATAGLRGSPGGADAFSFLGSSEHYLMWKDSSKPYGFYVRAGRFMAPYGLRLVEHPAYTQRYTGNDTFAETYGASVGYIQPGYEVHLTGFVHDFLRDPVEHGDGGALYAEKRLTNSFSLGVQGRYAKSTDESRTQGGITAKQWIEGANLMLQGQADLIHQDLNDGTGASRNQLASYVLASYFAMPGWSYDVGVGYYNEDMHVQHLDREAFDINLHYIPWPHFEFILSTRVETLSFGNGGPTSGYGILQLHYHL